MQALPSLRQAKGLKHLIIGPGITRAAALELNKALPACQIERIDAKGRQEAFSHIDNAKP